MIFHVWWATARKQWGLHCGNRPTDPDMFFDTLQEVFTQQGKWLEKNRIDKEFQIRYEEQNWRHMYQ